MVNITRYEGRITMKLALISDTHGQHRQLDMSLYPADVLIHAGDWTRGADKGLSETQDFFDWFSQQPYNHLICIAGNHEKAVEANPDQLSELLLMYPCITYLENSGITIDGTHIWGSPYSNEFCNWAFMEYEPTLSKIWDLIPDNTNILITHGPAYNCHDKVLQTYGGAANVGSQSLKARKLSIQDSLKLHVSGHIHEAYGTTTTNCINVCPSVLNEQYQLVNKPIIVTI